MRAELASEQIARSSADRDRQIKHAKDAAALAFRKKVGNKSRRDGDEGRLSHSDQCVANQQLPVRMRDRGEQRKSTPENRAQNDDQLARIPVS